MTRFPMAAGLLLLVLGHAGRVFADYPIEVIELYSRSSAEILPVIEPFAGGDGSITGIGRSLVIKASPERMAEIKRLLAELDRPPKRLLITVGYDEGRARDSSGYRASADIKTGNSQIGVNSPGYPVDASRARLQLHDRRSSTTQSSQQFIQATEGQSAYISSGLSVPLQTSERYYGGAVPYQRSTTQYHDVTRGFYVIPRIKGDIVTLEINQHNDQPGRKYGVIETQRVDTVVSGRLGDWIDLGGVSTTQAAHQGGLGRSVDARQGRLQGIQMKVECLNCAEDR